MKNTYILKNLGFVIALFGFFSTGCWSGLQSDRITRSQVSGGKESISNRVAIEKKAELRTSEQKAFRLKNGLDVVVISDRYLSQASASMDVGVGSLADPKEYQGLAHYLEHMLFLGTKKFPRVGEYDEFLSLNQGSSNAYTADENTNYHFDVNAYAFEGALDRFAQFFIAPIFDERFIEREIKVVQLEYNKNIENDYWRKRRILNTLTNPGHPLGQFHIGNRKSLSGVPQKVLKEWHKKYYSASVMKLVIIGPQDVATLESWARKYFASIPNNKSQRPQFSQDVVSKDRLPMLVRMQPIQKKSTLVLAFPAKSSDPYWSLKPLSVLHSLFGDEQPGSILFHLKKRGWATALAGGGADWSFGSTVQLKITLTDEGEKNWQSVVQEVFSYADLLRKGVSTVAYDNLIKSRQLEYIFGFQPKDSSGAVLTAEFMQDHPTQQAVERGILLFEKDPDQLKSFLAQVRPDNMIVLLETPNQPKGKLYEEKWQIHYGKESLKESEWMKRWRTARTHSGLSLPEQNDFLPKDLKDLELKGKQTAQPLLAVEEPGKKVWGHTDHEFKMPKVKVDFKLYHKMGPVQSDVRTAMLSNLATHAFAEAANSWAYPGLYAGYEFHIEVASRYSTIAGEGYSDQFLQKFSEYLQLVSELAMDDNFFQMVKRRAFEQYEGELKGHAYKYSIEAYSHIVYDRYVSIADRQKALEGATKEELQKFVQGHFKSFFLTGLVFGSVKSGEVAEISNSVFKAFAATPLPEKQITLYSHASFPAGTFGHKVVQSQVPNNSWMRHYQFGVPSSSENDAMTRLAAALFDAPFYQEMRTKRSLGYIVASWAKEDTQFDSLNFLIQTDKSITSVEEAIDGWMAEFVKSLASMKKSEFAGYQKGLVKKLTSPPESFAKKFEAKKEQVVFYRNDPKYLLQLADHVSKTTPNEISQYLWKGMISESDRKVLGVHALARGQEKIQPLKSVPVDRKDFTERKTVPGFY